MRESYLPGSADHITPGQPSPASIWNVYSALAPPAASHHSYRIPERPLAESRRETRCMTHRSSAATSSNATTTLLRRPDTLQCALYIFHLLGAPAACRHRPLLLR